VFAEGLEGLFGTIGGRGKAVGAEPDPGQERSQGHVMKDAGIHRVPRFADDDVLERFPGRHGVSLTSRWEFSALEDNLPAAPASRTRADF
jgi:hypothetical protein